jgi:pyruvate dehydrogenase E2 component (dihydrolipoamide acetyltransferase)
MSIFTMPSLGADMESGTLMEWKVKEGDRVQKGQVIAEVESNKGVIDVEIFEDGVVDKLLVEPGTTCAVGTPIASIRGENEAAAPSEEETPTAAEPESRPVKVSEAKEEEK